MVLCPVDCSAEVHFTTIFALRNGKIFEVGGWLTPHSPLSFVPDSNPPAFRHLRVDVKSSKSQVEEQSIELVTFTISTRLIEL